MRKGGRLAAVIVVAAAAWCSVPPSARAAGPEFADQRPIVFDLDAPSRLQGPWEVHVLNATDAATTVTLTTAGVPAVRVVSGTSPSIPPGGIATFAIDLVAPPQPQQGQLLATTAAGAVARRDVRIVHGGRTGPPPDIRIAGRRLAPFFELVVFDEAEDVRWEPTDGDVAVGLVRTSHGNAGRVVVDAGRVSVSGIEQAGKYTGTVRLGEGRESKVSVEVRDSLPWPALVLIAGLVLVSKLEDARKRLLPRRYIELRFQQFRDSLRAEEARAAAFKFGTPRVTGAPPAEQLVFDRAVADAMETMGSAQPVEGQAPWSESNEMFKGVVTLRDALRDTLQDYRGLASAVADLDSKLRPEEPRPIDIPLLEDVYHCLAIGSIQDEFELERFTALLTKHSAAVAAFAQVLDHIQDVIEDENLNATTRTKARRKRKLLLTSPGPLDDVVKEVRGFIEGVKRDGSPPGRVVPLNEVAVNAAGNDVLDDTGDAPAPIGQAWWPSRARTPIAVAAGVIAILALVLFLDDGGQKTAGPGVTTTSSLTSITPRPSPTLSLSTTTTTLLPAPPTAVAPAPVHGRAADPPSLPQHLGGEVLLPVAVILLAYGLTSLTLDERRRRTMRRAESSTALLAEIEEHERVFGLISSAIIVLTGMSVVYFGDDTFGSLGDYVKAFLWGSGVGEGVQLARRLLPRLSGSI